MVVTGFPKPKPIRLPEYLDFLKTLPCTACRRRKTEYLDIVPAHQGFGYDPGMARKNNDNLALPLCVLCHALEHQGSETFWRSVEKKYDRIIDRKMEIIKCLTLYIQRNNAS